MMGLSDGRKSFRIGLAVLIQYRRVTDTQPPSHIAVAITLNAQASSLKTILGFTAARCAKLQSDQRQQHTNTQFLYMSDAFPTA